MAYEYPFLEILEKYYQEYQRPLKYLDPRNISKTGDPYLLNEHNQTVHFYHALRNFYPQWDVIGWFELSIGKKLPTTQNGKSSTNALDGIVYIPETNTLFIIEAKGLRKETKFTAITKDFQRTIGTNRAQYPNDYILQMPRPSQMYAITLADLWGKPTGNRTDGWDIDFQNSKLSSRQKCNDHYREYRKAIGNGQLFSSEVFSIGGNAYRLLAMIYQLSEEEIDTYTFQE